MLETTGIPLDCSAQYAGMRTPAQEIYCKNVTPRLQVPFQVADGADCAPGFMRLHGGREQCSMVGHESELWQIASADAGIMYLQNLLGTRCIHCDIIVGVLASTILEYNPDSDLSSVLNQLQCDIACDMVTAEVKSL